MTSLQRTNARSRTNTTDRGGPVRRALLLTSVDGALAEWVPALAGGAALTAWALYLRSGPFLIAALAAVPPLAQALQLPAARLSARFGARRVALIASAAARQPYLVLAATPWLPLPTGARRALLVSVAASAAALGAIAQHAWLTWTADLFRGPIRGRVLGRRTGHAVLSGSLAAFGAGMLIDHARGSARPVMLAALAVAAWVAGLASTCVLARQHAPVRARRGAQAAAAPAPSAVRAPAARRALAYASTWNAALGVAAALTTVHMIGTLHLGFTAIALHGALGALAYFTAAPFWGRALDRFGVGRVLAVSTALAAAVPLLWLATSEETLWPAAIEAILGGSVLAGQRLAATTLPLSAAPSGGRDALV
ncbi:MAG: MFS transporter, partial [Anaeromyxobacteraceae bacterium]